MGVPGKSYPQLSPGTVAIAAAYDSCRNLNDSDLESRLERACLVDRRVTAVVIAHLAEFDSRKLWATSAYPSLFVYCTQKLGMSEQAAYKRIAAARAVRRIPEILGWMADGRVHLSAVVALAPHFTSENFVLLLELAAGKSKYELERLIAALSPSPDRRDVIRALTLSQAHPPVLPPPSEGAPPAAPAVLAAPEVVKPAPAAPSSRGSRQRIKPLSPGRVSFNFTGSEELRGKIERVREISWHTNPTGRLEILIERIADFYLDRNDPDRTIPRKQKRREARRAREAVRAVKGATVPGDSCG